MGRHTDEGGFPAEVHHQVGGAALAGVRTWHPVTTVTCLGGLHGDVGFNYYMFTLCMSDGLRNWSQWSFSDRKQARTDCSVR